MRWPYTIDGQRSRNDTRRHAGTFSKFPDPPTSPIESFGRCIVRSSIIAAQSLPGLGSEVLENLRPVFQTTGPVVIYPASGTGAWEAAIVNTLSPGDRVLMFETGHFSQLWRQLAERFGLVVDYVPGNWRRGAAAAEVASRLGATIAIPTRQ
jgi:aspartate aminotransferase-like enzyme